MPNPPKKFLSKAERISNAQIPEARANAMRKKRLLTQINQLLIQGGNYTREARNSKLLDMASRDFRTAGNKYSALVKQKTPAQKQGITKPSSQVKKAPKEGSRKFVGPRSQRGLLAEEVLATDPKTYREYVPKQSPKNRQASTKGKPEKRNPKDVLSAVMRANQAGNDVNSFTSRFSQSQNRQRFIEMVNAVNKLPPDSRKKLRDALKAGVRNSKIPF